MKTIGTQVIGQVASLRFGEEPREEKPARKRVPRVEFSAKQAEFIGMMTDGVLRGASYVLCGARGTGKTEMVGEVRDRLRDRRRSAGYIHLAQDVFEMCGALYHNSCNPRFIGQLQNVRNKLAGCALLVVDEIHDVAAMRSGGRMMRDLFVRRHAAGLPTILVTNMPASHLGLDSTILDRVNDHGCVIETVWPSFRGR